MNIAELLDPEIAGHVREQIMRDAKERIGAVYEIDLIAKDGRRIFLEVSTHVVLREGEPIEVQGIAVPSVIRDPSLSLAGPRHLDAALFFASAPTVTDIIRRIS